jgi:sugar/nucleoside kinase (ribokinase family)
MGMVTKKATVAIVGEFFVDEIFSEFGCLPKLGEESFARKFRRDVGGGAAITACGLARLGAKVSVVGVVGKADSGWVVERLTSCGIDCSGLEYDPSEPTGLTVSASTREDRAFLTYYGANVQLPALLQKPETVRRLSAARHVHFACAPDAEDDRLLFAALHRNRCRISIDVQSHVSWLTRPENLKVLQQCDVFFPNEREGGWIAAAVEPHDILRRLCDKGIPGVALKRGAKGAALLWKEKQFLADPLPVGTLDTTGAGDCFDAGFIFAWLRGDAPQQCLEVANICGALSTRALGGIEGFPSLRELTEFESAFKKRKTR